MVEDARESYVVMQREVRSIEEDVDITARGVSNSVSYSLYLDLSMVVILISCDAGPSDRPQSPRNHSLRDYLNFTSNLVARLDEIFPRNEYSD